MPEILLVRFLTVSKMEIVRMNTKNNKLLLLSLLLVSSLSLLWPLDSPISKGKAATKLVLEEKQSNYKDANSLQINTLVSNNGSNNLIGSIHVISSATGVTKNINDMTFPAGQTVNKTFKFHLNEIPIGTGFSIEVVYGDDFSKRMYGVNDPKNAAETFTINIP